MADEAYPLPGVSTVATLTEWETLFAAMAASGVVAGVGSELAPSLNSGARTAVMAAGGALVRGFYKPISSSTGTAIPAASGQNRVDRLVLRLDRSASLAANFIKPVVITGTPSGAPQPPALTQTTGGLWDLPIARWTSTSAGALSLLVDERLFVGGDTLSFRSTSRPAASPRRFGIENDTGLPVWSDGTNWNRLVESTDYTNYTPTIGGLGSGTLTGTGGGYWKRIAYKTVQFTVTVQMVNAGTGSSNVTVTTPTPIYRGSSNNLRQIFTAHLEKGSSFRLGVAVALAGGTGNLIDRIRVQGAGSTDDADNLTGVGMSAGAILSVQGVYREV